MFFVSSGDIFIWYVLELSVVFILVIPLFKDF
nr:MAG TPA: hypothetical protein [Caudoviricetes sp.]